MKEEKNTSILTDDVEQEAVETEAVEPTQRELMEEEIVKKQRKSRGADDSIITDELEEPVEDEVVEQEEEPAEDEQAEEFVKIIVNGDEKEVPKSQAIEQGIRTLQKESAADYKLKLAAQRHAELADYERRLTLKQQKLQGQVSKQPGLDADKFGEDFEKAIFDDDGKVSGMVKELVSEQKQLRELAESAAVRAQTAEQRAVNAEMVLRKKAAAERAELQQKFAEKFETINKDMSLRQMANERTVLLMQEHPEWTEKKVIMQAGKDVQDWLSDIGVKAPSESSSATDRKRSMVKQPNSVGIKSPAKPTVKRKTRADIFRAEKAARGQPIT